MHPSLPVVAPGVDAATIRRLERLTTDAWPALQTHDVDGWVVRMADGHTRRANSVAPLAAGSMPVTERIARCETLYRRQGLRPRFKMTASALPAGLDEELASRGWVEEAPTSVHHIALSIVRAPAGGPILPAGARLSIDSALPQGWIEANREASGSSPERSAVAARIRERTAHPSVYASVVDSGTIVATGYAVVVDGAVIVSDMATSPGHRRSGLATTVLQALLGWGRSRCAAEGVLQVMRRNAPARSVYERAGMAWVYDYWYRAAPEA